MHSAAHNFISDQYPELYEKADSKVQSAVKSSGMDRIRYTAWLFKVAESQITGTIERVKLVPLWDFVEILAYLTRKDKFNELMIRQ